MFTSHPRHGAVVLAASMLALTYSLGSVADKTASFEKRSYASSLRSKELISRIDTDGDGTISKAEWITFQQNVFTALDVDKSNSLSARIFVSRSCECMLSFRSGGFDRDFCSMETSRAIDTNGDDRITREEFMTYEQKLFDMMDTSLTHPGMLAQEEMFGTVSANRR